ncbi:MAG: hypothetical protein R8M11_03000 [Gallionella sp.]
MNYLLLISTLLLLACDKPATPKLAEPQRQALDKAKEVEQMMLNNAEAMKQRIEDEVE